MSIFFRSLSLFPLHCKEWHLYMVTSFHLIILEMFVYFHTKYAQGGSETIELPKFHVTGET